MKLKAKRKKEKILKLGKLRHYVGTRYTRLYEE
jgi:hypothetical protein